MSLDALCGERILVTGANGSVGRALVPALEGLDVRATDIDEYDVRHELGHIRARVRDYEPTVVFHLAASKHAPHGETHPYYVNETNVLGTRNVIETFPDARVVLTSTCKAADPETAYGASKLIAERMVLNAGGTVARLYNVTDRVDDNVFAHWASLPDDEPIPVAPCRRYFISMAQAVNLIIQCATRPTGRYTVEPGEPRWMTDVARELYPGRKVAYIPPRRGDRLEEPLCASSEHLVPVGGLLRIESPHDPVPAAVAVAA